MEPGSASTNIPRHVAIIMDGNGRWAKKRGMPRLEGHRRAVETVRSVINAAKSMGVRYLTLYAFSVENAKRPEDEVGGLMKLLEFFLEKETANLVKDKVRLLAIGRTQQLPAPVRRQLENAIKATAGFTDHTIILALNYGARTEMLDAIEAYARAREEGREAKAAPTWEAVSRYLYTRDIPDPDLVIRTSGEIRVSNFLLMQAAYAEFVFTPVLWPDFTKEDFAAALQEYARRERRFGLTGDQLKAQAKP